MKLLVTISLVMASSFALAADKLDWKKCDAEVKKFACKGDDKAIYECLEKHDADLSATCQETHEKGDKLFKK